MPKLSHEVSSLDPDTKALLKAIYPSIEDFLVDGSGKWLQSALHQQLPADGDSEREAISKLVEYVESSFAPRRLTGTQLLDQLRDSLRLLPTGSSSLDDLLRGGLKEGQITELCGESGSGKSFLCHLAAMTTAQRGEHVVYLDITNAFSASRCGQLYSYKLQQGSTQRSTLLSAHDMLTHITVVRPHSVHQLLGVLDQLGLSLRKRDSHQPKPCLLIVDSVSAVISPILGGQQHWQGHALMMEVGRRLKMLADLYGMAVLITNHVVAAGLGSSQTGAQEKRGSAASSGVKPALGEHWRSQPHVRVQLSLIGTTASSPRAGQVSPLGGQSRGVVCMTLVSAVMNATGEQKLVQFHDGGVADVPGFQ